ncbi:MAG: hypothetical protein PHN51_10225 [Candidatus Nanopelagicales bacterium]|nr:hypothetical protein [Candidatus Nanopelagicales bacterium]
MLSHLMVPMPGLPDYTRINETLLHMDFVNANYSYREVAVTPTEADRFQGNLYGLFYHLSIPPELHMYTMQLNGCLNPLNYDGKKQVFKVPVLPPIVD